MVSCKHFVFYERKFWLFPQARRVIGHQMKGCGTAAHMSLYWSDTVWNSNWLTHSWDNITHKRMKLVWFSFTISIKSSSAFYFSLKIEDLADNAVKIEVLKRISRRNSSVKVFMKHHFLFITQKVIHFRIKKEKLIPNNFNSHDY